MSAEAKTTKFTLNTSNCGIKLQFTFNEDGQRDITLDENGTMDLIDPNPLCPDSPSSDRASLRLEQGKRGKLTLICDNMDCFYCNSSKGNESVKKAS